MSDYCECYGWARIDGQPTRHHPNCQRFNEGIIDVWKVTLDGSSYYTDEEHAAVTHKEAAPEVTITKERMHREIYDNFNEFTGF